MAFWDEGWNEWRPLIVAGAGAWLIGVTVSIVLLALFSGFSSNPGRLLSAGVVFYFTFHLWPVIFVSSGLGAATAVFAPFTMVLLFWSGFKTTLRADLHHEDNGFRYGATIATGYFSLMLLSAPVFFLAAGVSPLDDVVVSAGILATTGIVFPIVFGGLGGWIAER